MKQNRGRTAAGAIHQGRMLGEPGLLVLLAALPQCAAEQTCSGKLSDRGDRRQARTVEVPARFRDSDPIMLRDVRQQFSADRDTHPVNDDHQHEVLLGKRRDHVLQNTFYGDQIATVGARCRPVRQQLAKHLRLLLADFGDSIEQLCVGFREFPNRIAAAQAESRPVDEPAFAKIVVGRFGERFGSCQLSVVSCQLLVGSCPLLMFSPQLPTDN